jgi:hypothetical protein
VRRRRTLIIIVAVVALFLVVSALLARVYSSVSAERSGVTALINAEARGNQARMIAELYGCRSSPGCRARVAQDATSLRYPGNVSILQLTVSTSFPLGGDQGVTRVAWEPQGHLPITQCVRVRHDGNPITGLKVRLLEISPRIKTNADCPKQF